MNSFGSELLSHWKQGTLKNKKNKVKSELKIKKYIAKIKKQKKKQQQKKVEEILVSFFYVWKESESGLFPPAPQKGLMDSSGIDVSPTENLV